MKPTAGLALALIGVASLLVAVVWLGYVDQWDINHCLCTGQFCGGCLGIDDTAPIMGSIGVGCLILAIIFSARARGEPLKSRMGRLKTNG